MGTSKLSRLMDRSAHLVRKIEHRMSRLCQLAAALLVFAGTQIGYAQTVSREAALRDLARNVIAAGYHDLASHCQAFSNAVAQFTAAPTQTNLDLARQAWTGVYESANRLRCFQTGPIVDHEYAATFYYVRISPQGIEGEMQSTNTIDAAYVAQLGGNVKGVFGLEYLLFGHTGYPGAQPLNASGVLETFNGKNSERRRAFLLALARDVDFKAAQLAQDWSAPGGQGAATKFANGGQSSINVLVNQLAHAVEDVNQAHVNFVLLLPKPFAGQIYRIEASASGASLEGAVAYLEGIEKFYRGAGGAGLADVLKQVNAPLAKRINDQFDTALTAVKAIGEPLDQAAQDKRDAVQKASDQVKALEILFKVDLASALGVTISFVSGDGD